MVLKSGVGYVYALILAGTIACLLATGCGENRPSEVVSQSVEQIKINALEPRSTSEGQAFHLRPDNQSAMVVFGSAIPAGAAVYWNDQALKSQGSGATVTAVVPQSLYQKPGVAHITIHAGTTVSNPLDFTVFAKTGPAPTIAAIAPDKTPAGQGFNVQPSGDSALGVRGNDFLPGGSLMLDGRKMTTVFGGADFISAAIPSSILAKTGSHQIWIENPDGKTSNKVSFEIK